MPLSISHQVYAADPPNGAFALITWQTISQNGQVSASDTTLSSSVFQSRPDRLGTSVNSDVSGHIKWKRRMTISPQYDLTQSFNVNLSIQCTLFFLYNGVKLWIQSPPPPAFSVPGVPVNSFFIQAVAPVTKPYLLYQDPDLTDPTSPNINFSISASLLQQYGLNRDQFISAFKKYSVILSMDCTGGLWGPGHYVFNQLNDLSVFFDPAHTPVTEQVLLTE